MPSLWSVVRIYVGFLGEFYIGDTILPPVVNQYVVQLSAVFSIVVCLSRKKLDVCVLKSNEIALVCFGKSGATDVFPSAVIYSVLDSLTFFSLSPPVTNKDPLTAALALPLLLVVILVKSVHYFCFMSIIWH